MSKAPPPPDFARILAQLRKSGGSLGKIGNMAMVSAFLGLCGYGLYTSVYFVPGGYRAVKFNALSGLHNRNYGEGAHLAVPYIETPVLFDVRSKPTEVTTSSGSRDLQMITMAVRVLYRPNTENLHHLYRNLGVQYAETVLPSLMNEVMKSVIAQFNASELLQKRPEVSHRIAVALRERAQHFFIDISDVSITQMSFGKEYSAAVEAKQIAQQMAERAKFQVEQAIQEKKSVIVLAEGEAESAKLIGNAIRGNPSFIELRRLDAARQISKMIAAGRGKVLLDSDTLMLNVESNSASTAAALAGSPNSSKK